MRALSPDQARAFLAKAADDEWFALWRLLLTTGIRPGEPCGLKWATGNELIFANPQDGPIDIRALVRPHFNRILSRAGLPHIRRYDLRHTAATILLASGVHVKVASEMLGHSTAVLTLDVFSHVLEGMQAEAAATMERVLTGRAG